MTVSLRPAQRDDARKILAWRNTSFIVERASGQSLVTWNEHIAWFEKALEANDRQIYIANNGDEDIGLVRFDLAADSKCIISAYVLEQHIGKGWGVAAICQGCEQIRQLWQVTEIIACVRLDNPMGASGFSKSGFVVKQSSGDCPDGHSCWHLKLEMGPLQETRRDAGTNG